MICSICIDLLGGPCPAPIQLQVFAFTFRWPPFQFPFASFDPPPPVLLRFHASTKLARRRRKRSAFQRSLCRLLTNLYDMSLKKQKIPKNTHQHTHTHTHRTEEHTHNPKKKKQNARRRRRRRRQRLSLSANRKFNGLMMTSLPLAHPFALLLTPNIFICSAHTHAHTWRAKALQINI